MTHTVDDCPGYNQDKAPEMLAAAEKMDSTAAHFGIKVHFLVSGLPEHVEYALVEADNPIALAGFFTEYPFRLSYKVTPVVHMKESIDKLKEMMARQQA
jgi:hypothetical protein